MTEYTLVFTNPPEDVDDVHDFLEEVWAAESSVTSADRIAFETAIIELAANVIDHAANGGAISCLLSVSATPASLTARLLDTGDPGSVSLSVRGMPDASAESGRGLALVQRLVDRVEFERVGEANSWWIERTREKA